MSMDQTNQFLGCNLWRYSDNRAILWLGAKHWGDCKRYLTYERGRAGSLGLQVEVGGEDSEVKFRLGLLFTTLYIGMTGVVPKANPEKLKAAAKARKSQYTYDIDYTESGVTSGLMIDKDRIEISFWENFHFHTNKPIREKMRGFPYCEGLVWSFRWEKVIGWKHVSCETIPVEGVHDYTNTLKNGETQKTTCTFKVEKRHWKRFGIFNKRQNSIWVEFEDELGERVGSWKGGTVGCGYNLNDGESPIECLRRMERERNL